MIKEKHIIYWAKCEKCFHKFDFLGGGDSQRSLFSKGSNHQVTIDWLEDPMFDEVSDILRNLLKSQNLSEADITKTFNKIFGKLCDPAPDGTEYDMDALCCPKCQGTDVDYGPTEPPEFREVEIPVVPHKAWDKMEKGNRWKKIAGLLDDKNTEIRK